MSHQFTKYTTEDHTMSQKLFQRFKVQNVAPITFILFSYVQQTSSSQSQLLSSLTFHPRLWLAKSCCVHVCGVWECESVSSHIFSYCEQENDQIFPVLCHIGFAACSTKSASMQRNIELFLAKLKCI